jgi:tetratricopeptide (TPR) repeat protein
LTETEDAIPAVSTPPAAPPSAVPLNLPLVARRPFFGRETERDKIVAAIRNRELVLVHGMGGIGKTSLAVAVAKQLSVDPEFAGSILWLNGAETDTIEALCDAIARQIGDDQIPQPTGDQKTAATQALLARRVRLVVLDDASTLTAQLFMQQCLPFGTALLCTDRERYVATDMNTDVRLAPLDREAAVALFRARTGAHVQASDAAVGAVCAALGNHLLALATAAGHVRRTDIPLDRLQTQLRQAHDPEVTASLALSFDNLPDVERRAITRLAAFFDTTTGVALLAGACELSERACEDAVGALVERAGNRLGLHLLVRDYVRDVVIGAEQLEAVRRDVLLALKGYLLASLDGTPEAEARQEAEIGNLQGAVEYAGAKRYWDVALSLADDLISDLSILERRGYWSERVAIGRVGITAARKEGDKEAEARLLHTTGIALQDRGEMEEAARLYTESLTIARQVGDQAGIAIALWALGDLAGEQREIDEAQRLYSESLAIFDRLGSPNAAVVRDRLELLE